MGVRVADVQTQVDQLKLGFAGASCVAPWVLFVSPIPIRSVSVMLWILVSQEKSCCCQLWDHHSLAGFGGSPGLRASFGQCLPVFHTVHEPCAV